MAAITQQVFHNLTEHEVCALKAPFNLADAHPHQSQSASQLKIVQRLPDLWLEAERRSQAFFNRAFTNAFFSSQGQEGVTELDRTFLTYASSVSMQIISTYLSLSNKSVALIEPCFDNLADILKSNRIAIQSMNEALLEGIVYENLAKHITGDVIFTVDPNNPTGFSMFPGNERFAELVKYCVDFEKLLILDLCFAPFALADPDVGRSNIYETLERSGVSYITIEDTGKAWPVQDAKCSLITTSEDLRELIGQIHSNIHLNVSPFLLNLLTHYVSVPVRESGMGPGSPLEQNREYLEKAFEGSSFEIQVPKAKVSTCWVKINGAYSSSELQQILVGEGVYILPGEFFFWAHPEKGKSHFRIALSRDQAYFQTAVDRLTSITSKI